MIFYSRKLRPTLLVPQVVEELLFVEVIIKSISVMWVCSLFLFLTDLDGYLNFIDRDFKVLSFQVIDVLFFFF